MNQPSNKNREWDKERAKFLNDTTKVPNEKEKGENGPSLTKAIFRAFGRKFMAVGLISLLEECIFK